MGFIMSSGIQETTTTLKDGVVLEITGDDFTDTFKFVMNGQRIGRFSIFRDEIEFPSGYRAAKDAAVSRIVEGEYPDGEPIIRIYGTPQGGKEEMLLVSLN